MPCIVQVMPLPLRLLCFSKNPEWLVLLVPYICLTRLSWDKGCSTSVATSSNYYQTGTDVAELAYGEQVATLEFAMMNEETMRPDH